MQVLTISSPESCSQASTSSANSQGRSGDSSEFDSILATAKGASRHIVKGHGGEKNPNTHSSPDVPGDTSEQADIDSNSIDAAMVATMVAMAVPATTENGGDLLIDPKNGSGSASGATTVVEIVGNEAAKAASMAFRVDGNQQVAAVTLHETNRTTAEQTEGLANTAGSAENRRSIGADFYRSGNQSAGESATSTTVKETEQLDLPVNQLGNRFSGGDNRSHSTDRAAMDQIKGGDGGAEKPVIGAAAERSSARINTTASVDVAGRVPLNNEASSGITLPERSIGTTNAAAKQGSTEPTIAEAVSAASQGSSSVTKAADGKVTDSVLTGDAAGIVTGRDISAMAASEKAEAALSPKSDLLDQILDHAAKLSIPRNTSMRVQLRPPELGWMDLRLEMKGGVLTLQITTESAGTKGLIETALPQLKQALQARDIQLGELSLEFNSGSGNPAGWLGSSTPSFDAHGQWAGFRRHASVTAGQQTENREAANFVAERVEKSSSHYLVDYRI